MLDVGAQGGFSGSGSEKWLHDAGDVVMCYNVLCRRERDEEGEGREGEGKGKVRYFSSILKIRLVST